MINLHFQERFSPKSYKDRTKVWRLSAKFGALRPEGHRFESRSSRHVRTLGKSFTHSCQ